MSLPNGIKARSRKEWSELANKSEGIDRKPVIEALKALGVHPKDYMSWMADKRVDFIMEAQGEETEEKKAKGKASGGEKAETTKSSASNGASNGASMGSKEIAALRAEVAEIKSLAQDTHFLIRILVQSNEDLKANSEDSDLQEALYGDLVVARGGNA